MPFDHYVRVLRVRFWEKGHSFDEVDNMAIQDIGDILAYWNESNRIERKRERTKKALSKSRSRLK